MTPIKPPLAAPSPLPDVHPSPFPTLPRRRPHVRILRQTAAAAAAVVVVVGTVRTSCVTWSKSILILVSLFGIRGGAESIIEIYARLPRGSRTYVLVAMIYPPRRRRRGGRAGGVPSAPRARGDRATRPRAAVISLAVLYDDNGEMIVIAVQCPCSDDGSD